MSDGLNDSDRKLRVGIVGLGFMGATHLAAYQRLSDLCELVAVCDRNAGRRAGDLSDVVGNMHSGSNEAAIDSARVRGYTMPDELFADDEVDLVDICTRTDTHVELAEAAMRAGKHVIVEKPVALTAELVEHLARVAEETGRVCMPAMCMRFWPGWTQLRDALKDGRYGELRRLRITRRGQRPDWSDFYADESRSGGALTDLHIHDTDLICSLFGMPKSVVTNGSTRHVSTIYGVDHPAHVVATADWMEDPDYTFTMQYVADFDGGTLEYILGHDEPLNFWDAEKDQDTKLTVDSVNGYERQAEHLVTCLREGKTPCVTIADAVVSHRVLDAERKSLVDGGPVAL